MAATVGLPAKAMLVAAVENADIGVAITVTDPEQALKDEMVYVHGLVQLETTSCRPRAASFVSVLEARFADKVNEVAESVP